LLASFGYQNLPTIVDGVAIAAGLSDSWGRPVRTPRLQMTAQPLPALTSGDPSAWDQALYAFLVEKGNRSGSRRTVESYSRMLWPFFAERSLTPDRVKPADVLAWVHGIGRSGCIPSGTTVGARIARLSSFYRFLIRMGLLEKPSGLIGPPSEWTLLPPDEQLHVPEKSMYLPRLVRFARR
jgi:hypothetical protein